MLKVISILFTIMTTSMYFFPFEFMVLKGVNTKMGLAAAGLVILIFQMARNRTIGISKDFLMLLLFSALVSFVGVFSITINNTSDGAYASYLVSMAVWLSAAYTICSMIKLVHGSCSMRLLCNYLIAVCVMQCVLAIWIDSSIHFKKLVDTYILQGQDFLNATHVKRLYGIGAGLDVAGSRFSAVLVIIMYLLANIDNKKWYHYVVYLFAFATIAVIGNIIARTTLVGLVLALVYLILMTAMHVKKMETSSFNIWKWLLGVLVICLPLIFYCYDTIPRIQHEIRFGFEGFFNLVENGKWAVSSNDKLQTMYVFPKTLKTWIIGDGYFNNPFYTDVNYIGPMTDGFYMGTDVGYLRFIFYFGMVGLIAMSVFILESGIYCMHKFVWCKILFLMLLAINFIIWFKVSTDIFLVFALFIYADDRTVTD